MGSVTDDSGKQGSREQEMGGSGGLIMATGDCKAEGAREGGAWVGLEDGALQGGPGAPAEGACGSGHTSPWSCCPPVPSGCGPRIQRKGHFWKHPEFPGQPRFSEPTALDT